LIQNGSFETVTNSNFNCATDVLPNQNFPTSAQNAPGWTAIPDCAGSLSQNTPNVKKNGCSLGNTPFGNNFLFLGLKRNGNNSIGLDERVRAKMNSPIPTGSYQFTANINFDASSIEFGTPGTLLISLGSGQCSGMREIGRRTLSTVNDWTTINFCVTIAAGESFNEIEFRLINLQGSGQAGGHVCIDEVSLQRIPEAVEDFDVNFETGNPWGFGKMTTMKFTPRGSQSPLLNNYGWTIQNSFDFGNTWNQGFGWYNWDGSITSWAGMGAHVRAIRTAQSICPNVAVCTASSIVYVNYAQSGYTDDGYSAPGFQDFNMNYIRDINGARFTATPSTFIGLTDEWREGGILWWPNDYAFTNPEWGDNNGNLPYSGFIGLYNWGIYRTIGHRVSKGGSPTFGDKITFLESHNANCSWFNYVKKRDDNELKPEFNQKDIAKIQEEEAIMRQSAQIGKKKVAKISGLQVFPNPTYGQAKVVYESSSASKITVYDITGKLLIERNVNAEGNIEELLDCSDFNSGIYLLKVSNASKVLTKKLVIRK
jgi:hypothetical protein